jgi:hypothetical protein
MGAGLAQGGQSLIERGFLQSTIFKKYNTIPGPAFFRKFPSSLHDNILRRPIS